MTPAIWYHLYGLQFKDSDKGKAQGALLKYRFTNDTIGYASLPAWPQVGDQSLAEKLKNLKANPRSEPQSSWASLDAELREAKQPALPIESRLPRSHWHMQSRDLRNPGRWTELIAAGYGHWKLKVDPTMAKDAPLCELAQFAQTHSVKLRLDGNGSFVSKAELEWLFESLGGLEKIEFFEDPSTDKELWTEVRRVWGVSVAADWFRSEEYPSDLVIHKPSRDFVVPEGMDFVITTAFDHPLGLNYTAYKSLQLRDHPRLRTPLGIEHPDLYTCDGIGSEVTFGEIGFGWADLLEDVAWHQL